MVPVVFVNSNFEDKEIKKAKEGRKEQHILIEFTIKCRFQIIQQTHKKTAVKKAVKTQLKSFFVIEHLVKISS